MGQSKLYKPSWKQILAYRMHRMYRTIAIIFRFVFTAPVIVLLLIVIMLFSYLSGKSQNTITLQMCYDNADSLYPIAFQKQKLMQINELAIENLQAKYLPTIGLIAKATYQSKVTEIPIAMPGVDAPVVPHEQFAATIDVSQIIYDGGKVKAVKEVTSLKAKADVQQVEVSLYKLKENINSLYFVSLVLQENISILDLMQENIKERKLVLQSAVDNGMINQSELDKLDAELLKIDQQKIELETHLSQTIKALNELACITISEDDILELPVPVQNVKGELFRPEHQYFVDNVAVLDANIQVNRSDRMPKLMAFGSGGMGYPGLDMFSGEVQPYFIVGAQLKWDIVDWKQTQRKTEQINLQKASIIDSENAFNKQLAIQMNDEVLKQEKIEKLIEKDNEIIELRKRITKRSASQLENGTITSADYIVDLNAEKQALINLNTHKIQLVQAKVNQVYLSGKSLSGL